MRAQKAICSWSGGKDSCLALYKALQQGYHVTGLLNFISRETGRGCFHGITSDLLKAQARSVGIPLIQKETTADMAAYEEEFKEAVREEMARGATHMVFGDIYLIEHTSWIERVCGEIGIIPVMPLWNGSPGAIAREFIGLGFRAMIVSCKADALDGSFPGNYLDARMIDEFERRGICPCGENGEYHTFVTDGPLFKEPLSILQSKTILRDGFWRHYFLDIQKYAYGENISCS